jgi:hypothetical protein
MSEHGSAGAKLRRPGLYEEFYEQREQMGRLS